MPESTLIYYPQHFLLFVNVESLRISTHIKCTLGMQAYQLEFRLLSLLTEEGYDI